MSAIKLKNKIYIVLIAIVLIVIAIVAILLINNSASRVVITNDKEEKVMNTNALTMMYETEAGSGEYQVSSDTTWPQDGYIFNERLSGCENGSALTWDDERKAVILSTNVSDKCYVYFDKEPEIVYFADYIIDNVYVEDGVNGLYYHDGVGTYTNADQEAEDYSYRFSGAYTEVINHVCFGTDAETCPEDNMYQIIGVFNGQAKLIKVYPATGLDLGIDGAYDTSQEDATEWSAYWWNNSTNTNVWSESNLNTINLNKNYLTNIGSEWSSKITEHTWQVGGNTYENIVNTTAKKTYTNEIISPAENITYNAKIGLMYLSDYGYAAEPIYWNTPLSNYDDAVDENYLATGLISWIITRDSSSYEYTFSQRSGMGNIIRVPILQASYVFPVFYLNSDVQYISGTGTESDPFRIA